MASPPTEIFIWTIFRKFLFRIPTGRNPSAATSRHTSRTHHLDTLYLPSLRFEQARHVPVSPSLSSRHCADAHTHSHTPSDARHELPGSAGRRPRQRRRAAHSGTHPAPAPAGRHPHHSTHARPSPPPRDPSFLRVPPSRARSSVHTPALALPEPEPGPDSRRHTHPALHLSQKYAREQLPVVFHQEEDD